MLLWERLTTPAEVDKASEAGPHEATVAPQRLPYDKRCSAITKAGRRCRGRIRKGTEFCPFHDPTISAERRRRSAAQGGRRHHKLAHLPDGYLRKLTSRRAVGNAMDRLYREVRLGSVTPEMGTVLFGILTRVLDSGLCQEGATPQRSTRRCKADRVRPKLSELLTQVERRAWRKAVANAPAEFLYSTARPQCAGVKDYGELAEQPGKVALPAAS